MHRQPDEIVGVVGLGYVGLPLSLAFAEAGLSVIGIEASPDRVKGLRAGASPIDDISDVRLRSMLGTRFEIEEPSAETVARCDVVFVCVPTPLDEAKNPDLTLVLAAGATVASGLRRGQLVVLQSTTYPGTTTGPFREVLEASGLRAGVDFDLAFAPERVNPGDPQSLAGTVPRLVGGQTPAATERAVALLERISTRVIGMSSPDAAELAKLHENIFRNVNIALVNQLALLCERMGLDVWEVLDAAGTKPFGFMRFTPGPGVGGHCIPVDPYYLSWRARHFDFVDRFVETAGDINLAMPRHVVTLAAAALNKKGRALNGARIGVIGVAFKPDVSDTRNSPAGPVLAQLRAEGADVEYHDPHAGQFQDASGWIHRSLPLASILEWSELVVILTAHRAVDWDLVFGRSDLILDTVNTSRGRNIEPDRVLRLGASWGTQRSSEPVLGRA